MSAAAEQIVVTRTTQGGSDAGARRAGRRTLVVGLGATGLAVARHLARRHESVLVVDSRVQPPGLDPLRAQWPDVRVVCESLEPRWLDGIDTVVLSPGLGIDLPLVVEAQRLGIEIVGDIELFAREADAPVIAITGSNGKSTVTSLVAHMLAAAGRRAPAGGNLGPPALDLLGTDAVIGSAVRGPELANQNRDRRATRSATHAPGQPSQNEDLAVVRSLGDKTDFYVLEISSFQMETTQSLRPRAAAVLNVSADHLDRHGGIERYAGLKEKLLKAAEVAVFNYDDPLVRAMLPTPGRAVAFSVATPLEEGYSVAVHAGRRFLCRNAVPLLATDELALRGTHNEANALAALALVAGADPDLDASFEDVARRVAADLKSGDFRNKGANDLWTSAQAVAADFNSGDFRNSDEIGTSVRETVSGAEAVLTALSTFQPLAHRCQRVAVRAGVTYIDDSKGTNVGASIAAIDGLAGPLILIAGGVGKGADFAPLANAARGKVKAALLIGQAAVELECVLSDVCPSFRMDDLPAAVVKAAELASAGDTVLLSPACASLDQFRDYRHRGEVFAAAAEGLPE